MEAEAVVSLLVAVAVRVGKSAQVQERKQDKTVPVSKPVPLGLAGLKLLNSFPNIRKQVESHENQYSLHVRQSPHKH
jgi:hypothetical protein